MQDKEKAKADLAQFMAPYVTSMKETQAFNKRIQEMGVGIKMTHLVKPKYGFICPTDFYHELGEASGGVIIYPSVKDMLRLSGCAESCGIFKVEVSYVDTALEGKEEYVYSTDIDNLTPEYVSYERRRIKHYREKAEYYTKLSGTLLGLAGKSEESLEKRLNEKKAEIGS